jgi:hypothetical protein
MDKALGFVDAGGTAVSSFGALSIRCHVAAYPLDCHHRSDMARFDVTTAGAQAALTVGVGIAVGIATLLGQSVLPAEWNRLANSGAIWLLASYLVGSRMPTNGRAAVAGMATLVLAVVAYYVAARLAGAGVSTRTVVIWIGTALVGGPVYGVAGHSWQAGPDRRRIIAIGLMGGIVTAEGVSTLLRIPELAAVGWVEAVAGLSLVILLGRSGRERLLGLAVVPFVVLAGVAAYEILDRVIAG